MARGGGAPALTCLAVAVGGGVRAGRVEGTLRAQVDARVVPHRRRRRRCRGQCRGGARRQEEAAATQAERCHHCVGQLQREWCCLVTALSEMVHHPHDPEQFVKLELQ